MFFRDYLCTDNSRQLVASPTILRLTHGVGACKFEEKRIEITLAPGLVSNSSLTFVIRLLWKNVRGTCTYVLVLAISTVAR